MLTLGIDLGTTASVVAYSRNGSVQVIEADCGKITTPSVVNYSGNRPIVGREAMFCENSSDSVFSVKRFMGTDRKFFGRSVVEVSADIISYLKRMSELSLGQEIDAAVITVPAHFSDSQRTATKHAASLAGVRVLRLVNEPTAAALAFGLDRKKEGIFGVYDFGGGTFDFSILRLFDGIFQVIATGGDNYLGGDDLDNDILKFNLSSHGLDISQLDDVEKIRGRLLAKSMKESVEKNGEIHKEFFHKNIGFDFSLSLEILEKLAQNHIQRTLEIAEQVFMDARTSPEKLNGILLTGGMTRLHTVKETVKKHFGIKIYDDINPDEAVAIGAAIHADSIAAKSNDTLLIDVVPLTLGIETFGGGVDKIIHRNTPIPTVQRREYTTQVDNQTGMKFHVVQGEKPQAKDCKSMANFELSGIPPMPFGKPRIEVEFFVDVNGLLFVSAHEKSTGVGQSIVVESDGNLSGDEIFEILENAIKNRALYSSEEALIAQRVECERMIRFWQSILNEIPEVARKLASERIDHLKNVLITANYEEIVSTKKDIERIFSAFIDQIINARFCGKNIHDI